MKKVIENKRNLSMLNPERRGTKRKWYFKITVRHGGTWHKTKDKLAC